MLTAAAGIKAAAAVGSASADSAADGTVYLGIAGTAAGGAVSQHVDCFAAELWALMVYRMRLVKLAGAAAEWLGRSSGSLLQSCPLHCAVEHTIAISTLKYLVHMCLPLVYSDIVTAP